MEFTISSSFKEQLINNVINVIKLKNLIPDISKNYSSEEGFELPLTEKWFKTNFINKDIALKYHSSRQLRFIDDGNVIRGLRFKDDCNYWSDEELYILYNEIQKFINNI